MNHVKGGRNELNEGSWFFNDLTDLYYLPAIEMKFFQCRCTTDRLQRWL